MRKNCEFKIDYDFLKNEFPDEVYDWVKFWAEKAPTRKVIIDINKREYTYGELLELAKIQAVNLYELGVKQGTLFATLEMNSANHFAVIIAASLLRATLVPLNWRLKNPELEYMVADSNPVVLLYGEKFQDNAFYLEKAVRVFSLNEISQDGSRGMKSREEMFNKKIGELEMSRGDYDKTVSQHALLILYTAGTTGFPKGAMVSERQTKQNAINTVIDWGLSEGERYILCAPLFHTGGWNVLALPLLMTGGEIVIHEKFDVEATLNDIEKYKITLFFGVPTMFLSLMESISFSSCNLSSIKFLVSGGAPCPPYIIETFSKKGLVFRQGFGLTEVGPNCFTLPPEDAIRKIGSVGFPMKASIAKLIDENGNEITRENEVGELILAGEHVCMGYLGKPDEYKKSNPDGFFRTGDYAMRDSEGYYYIAGRKKEMFISGGENVYPKEIEDRLTMLPEVTECAVVGIPDPKWGEVGLASVVLRNEYFSNLAEIKIPLENQIREHLKKNLASYKIPKKIEFLDALPKNAVGKIDKKQIRENHLSSLAD
ncbi:MAG TPA: AMP-binding protein [Candidatus Wallbacteria bacterium]|nr:AMP-binding protein [Candidatus Wallbacteria bacterium]